DWGDQATQPPPSPLHHPHPRPPDRRGKDTFLTTATPDPPPPLGDRSSSDGEPPRRVDDAKAGRAPGSVAPVAWRRNLFAVTAAGFMGYTGFTIAMPFLPLFIGAPGVTG